MLLQFANSFLHRFVLNNKGYTVERLIHGLNAAYNTIPDWDYCALFKGFGPEVNSKTYKVSSSAELDDLMKDEAFNHSKYPQVR
jgi:pyruvate decarboxylase